MNASGNAVAIWELSGSGVTMISSSRFLVATSNWEPVWSITSPSGVATTPQVAIGGDGTTVATWVQNDGSTPSIYSSTWNGTVWTLGALVETSNVGAARNPRIAVDDSGNAYIAWTQNIDAQKGNVFVVRRAKGGQWSNPISMQTSPEDAAGIEIATGGDNSAMAVWTQVDTGSPSTATVWSSRWTSASGWTAPMKVETNSANAYTVRIAIDAVGNALAVWRQATSSTWASRYSPTSGWGTSVQLGQNPTGEVAGALKVSIDANGDAVAAWPEIGPLAIRYSRFD
jgi:hypothetical protein